MPLSIIQQGQILFIIYQLLHIIIIKAMIGSPSLDGHKIKDYKLFQKIGEGTFSVVYKAVRQTEPSKKCAIKIFKEIPQNDQVFIKNEIMLLSKCRHPNIVNMVEAFEDKKMIYIVFQFCSKGDLNTFYKKQGKLPEPVCKKLASSMLNVFSYLHQQNIVHRDLKLANILINDQLEFKLADFGLSKLFDNLMLSYCGSLFAMAPQILNNQQYNQKCDVWSLGVMIYQISHGKLPFTGQSKFQAINKIKFSQPIYNQSLSLDCLNFIKQCLKKNPNQRPSMNQLKNFQWFSSQATVNCKQFLNMNLNGKQNQIKMLIILGCKQHVKKAIKQFRLSLNQIQKNLQLIQNYTKGDKQIREAFILIIDRAIKQIIKSKIEIKIAKRTFTIELKQLNAVKQHFNQLFNQMSSKVSSVSKQSVKNYNANAISFILSEAEKSLGFNYNNDEAIKNILYMARLLMNQVQNSQLTITCTFQQQQVGAQELFQKYIQTLNDQMVLEIANSDLKRQNLAVNSIFESNFLMKRKPEGQFMLCEFMAKIIESNSNFNP